MTPRLFTAGSLFTGSLLELDAAAAHHAVRVLRLGVNDPVVLFDGRGAAAQGIIASTDPCTVAVHTLMPQQPPPDLTLTLAQCISAADKMDWTIEKAVELGVAEIIPLQSRKGIVKLSPERAAKRHEHWQRLILAAAGQSGQNRLPRLDPVRRLETWLGSRTPDPVDSPVLNAALRVILDPREPRSLGSLLGEQGADRPDRLILLCGPESGFTVEEYQQALDAGWKSASLGPRVLRTETAGLVALAIVQAMWGDLR